MDYQCDTVRQNLVEKAGDPEELGSAGKSHLKSCKDCQAFASSEERLVEILTAAAPPSDLALQRRVILAVQVLEARRRRMALLPVAASFIVGLVGVSVLGGIPGASLVAALPAWAGSGWVALMGTILDTVSALRAVASGLAGVISAPVIIGAAVVVMAGAGTMVLVSKRWRRRAVWSVRS